MRPADRQQDIQSIVKRATQRHGDKGKSSPDRSGELAKQRAGFR